MPVENPITKIKTHDTPHSTFSREVAIGTLLRVEGAVSAHHPVSLLNHGCGYLS